MMHLRDHTAPAEHEIATEVDRYIAWPGQALAYKLGELQIRGHIRRTRAIIEVPAPCIPAIATGMVPWILPNAAGLCTIQTSKRR